VPKGAGQNSLSRIFPDFSGDMQSVNIRKLVLIACVLLLLPALTQLSFAQGLNWEGQTGAILTPFAYTASSPGTRLSKPELAFHYLNGGNVIGNDYQFSITEGLARHFEFGYSGALSSAGSVGPNGSGNFPPSYLFSNGFNEFHGKVKILNENAGRKKWIPAIALGTIGRTGIQRGSFFYTPQRPGSSETNGDFYAVATKTLRQKKRLPILLSVGEKVTNASLMGIAGDAPHWQGRTFGAVAFAIRGPASSALAFGSEVLQQPRSVEGLNASLGERATIPTSLSYFVRLVPHMDRSPMQLDFAVTQLAGKICNIPGKVVDLNARAQITTGISYHF
jgi:hypothetical protein